MQVFFQIQDWFKFCELHNSIHNQLGKIAWQEFLFGPRNESLTSFNHSKYLKILLELPVNIRHQKVVLAYEALDLISDFGGSKEKLCNICKDELVQNLQGIMFLEHPVSNGM